jgi:hypothetical protein
VSIPTDSSVFMAICATLARLLTLQHLAVLVDAMAVPLRNSVFGGDGLVLSGSPCEVITADLNIVVGEFAELVVVHTKELSLFGSAEVKTGDLVDDESENGADDESIGGHSNDVCNLHVQLLPVVLDPATWEETSVDTIETNDIASSEKTVEEETDHASDTVLSEHIEGIINFDPELDYFIVRI